MRVVKATPLVHHFVMCAIMHENIYLFMLWHDETRKCQQEQQGVESLCGPLHKSKPHSSTRANMCSLCARTTCYVFHDLGYMMSLRTEILIAYGIKQVSGTIGGEFMSSSSSASSSSRHKPASNVRMIIRRWSEKRLRNGSCRRWSGLKTSFEISQGTWRLLEFWFCCCHTSRISLPDMNSYLARLARVLVSMYIDT